MKGVKDSLPAEQLIEPCLNGRIDSHCNKLFRNKWIFQYIYVELPENISLHHMALLNTQRGVEYLVRVAIVLALVAILSSK